ncbi:MAG: hypothetical protein DWH99_03960 [Planctomycetota bacterium]|nr:MAG: hypothetical protein DWH99_03960 [Planctomycetota bacterium]
MLVRTIVRADGLFIDFQTAFADALISARCRSGVWALAPRTESLYGWLVYSKIRKALFSMSIEIVNTIVGILFVGIWLIVGHIITINHS